MMEICDDHEARRRVLVIDDQPAVRGLVCDILAALGYEADGAADGVEGLALLERHRYALVLTDLRMPRMTGWEVAEAVRHRAPATGVIVMSGSATGHDVERARELGLVLLDKPAPLSAFRAAIDRTLKPAVTRSCEGAGRA